MHALWKSWLRSFRMVPRMPEAPRGAEEGGMISVILPTIRPAQFRRSFDSVAAAADGVSYEIVVVADFENEGLLHCQWIVAERRGVIDAINVAYDAARGDHLFLSNDESWLEAGALRTLLRECEATPEQLLSPLHIPPYPFFYYGLPFVPFPFATRRLFDSLGGMLDPAYRGFYADPDLSMRAHAAGVTLRVVPEARLHHEQNLNALGHRESIASYLAADRETFRRRWDHLGEFRDP